MSRRTPLPAALAAATLIAAAIALAGCSADRGQDEDEEQITVLAASSLTDVFTDLGKRFEDARPGSRVTFAFGSSATLAEQAAQGAPADVLATADAETMATAESADILHGAPVAFATNSLVIAARRDADVSALTDLDSAEVTYAACVDTAPCGQLAVLAMAGLRRPPVSFEPDARAVLARVTEGEVDAGFVYASDAAAAGDVVRALPLPGVPPTTYFAATLRQAESAAGAEAWLGFLRADEARRVLRAAGFGAP